MFYPQSHLIRCIPSTRAPSSVPYPFAPCYIPYFIAISAFSIKHNIFNGIYILPALLRINKGVFAGFGKHSNNSSNYDGGGTRLLSQNLSVRVRYTRTQRSPSHRLLASCTRTPFVLVSSFGVGSSSNNSSKGARRISTPFAVIEWQTLDFIVLATWVRSALGWRYRRWQWVIQADIRQAALKGEDFPCICVVRRRFVKAKTGEAGLEDMGMRARRIVLIGLECSETPGGRLIR